MVLVDDVQRGRRADAAANVTKIAAIAAKATGSRQPRTVAAAGRASATWQWTWLSQES
jgi:hypothetical protein